MFLTGVPSFTIFLPLPLSMIIVFFSQFLMLSHLIVTEIRLSHSTSLGKVFIFQNFNAHHKD